MEDIFIAMDEKGGTAILTTDTPMSSHGIPILRINAENIKGDFEPGDIIGDDCTTTAAEVVVGWAKSRNRTEAELKAATVFLKQWPEGPQI